MVGKAEAEWGADLERHLWAMYAGISNDTPKGTWLSQQDFPADTKFPDTLAQFRKTAGSSLRWREKAPW